MELPLEKRLKRRLHAEVGMLQDEVAEAAYAIDSELVLHGGTAIWRCFSGNRFSEDLDFYCRKPGKIEEELAGVLQSRALVLSKFKRTENLIFAKITNGQAEVRLEMNLSAKVKAEARRYERINGSSMDVLCPPADALLAEKAAAYHNRRFVRDLYDVYHLSGIVAESRVAQDAVRKMLKEFEPPVDEANLPALIYSGAVPSVQQMVLVLKRRWL